MNFSGDMSGKRFNHLTTIKKYEDPKSKRKASKWICRCDCGKELNVFYVDLTKNIIKSCGCKDI